MLDDSAVKRLGNHRKCSGFTLVEVMVALVIIGMALPALLMQMSSMASSAIHSRNVTMAYWVAENKMQEIRLVKLTQGLSPKGRQAGDVELAGVKWDWQTEAVELPGAEWQGFFRIWVRVKPQGEKDDLVEISGFFLE